MFNNILSIILYIDCDYIYSHDCLPLCNVIHIIIALLPLFPQTIDKDDIQTVPKLKPCLKMSVKIGMNIDI